MTNYQIISGFVCAQEKLLHTKQSSSFYDTRKNLVFDTNYLYVKGGNFSELKPIAKTYFTSSSDGYTLHFELLDYAELPERQKGYLKELKRQILNKYYSDGRRDERISNVSFSIVNEIRTDVPILDILKVTNKVSK